MVKTLDQVGDIVRKVTGRTDNSVSGDTIFDYIEDFYQLIMGQDMRIFDNRSYYEFNTVASQDTYPIDLPTIQFSVLQGPAWVDGFRIELYTNPEIFFAKWPETQEFTEQRPVAVLWYNNELVFRAPPDDVYSVKMKAYKINDLSVFRNASGDRDSSGNIAEDYWFRYIAYGAAIDLLSDAGEYEKIASVMPLFERYKSLVNARTYTQMKENQPIRRF